MRIETPQTTRLKSTAFYRYVSCLVVYGDGKLLHAFSLQAIAEKCRISFSASDCGGRLGQNCERKSIPEDVDHGLRCPHILGCRRSLYSDGWQEWWLFQKCVLRRVALVDRTQSTWVATPQEVNEIEMT